MPSLKLIRGGAMPGSFAQGEIRPIRDAVTIAARRILPAIDPHSRGGGPAMCIASAEGCERRAGFARAEGRNNEAKAALAEAASWRAHAATLTRKPLQTPL